MDARTMQRRLEAAQVGHLGTTTSDGAPHVVAVCFALLGEAIYSAVDHKPKHSTRLRRIANIEATGRACLLIDEYHDDWTRLWWVRVDGPAWIVRDPAESQRALAALAAKYPQYAERPPTGPTIAINIGRWKGWSAL
jgi:PPOX class probable F420-dependent enzyme